MLEDSIGQNPAGRIFQQTHEICEVAVDWELQLGLAAEPHLQSVGVEGVLFRVVGYFERLVGLLLLVVHCLLRAARPARRVALQALGRLLSCYLPLAVELAELLVEGFEFGEVLQEGGALLFVHDL